MKGKKYVDALKKYDKTKLYDMGEDVDFGKPAYRLSQLRKPPYYGFWLGACILTTEQGLRPAVRLADAQNRIYRCAYCESKVTM